MFKDLRLSFPGGRVLDIGCGPSGMPAYIEANIRIGVEPLAEMFHEMGTYNEPHQVILTCTAEEIPLPSGFVDAVFCVNALDHFKDAVVALKEMSRVLKRNGYLALACDVGGTPDHPIVLVELKWDKFLLPRYEAIERRCTSEIRSSHPAGLKTPVYVFEGIKRPNKEPIDNVGR